MYRAVTLAALDRGIDVHDIGQMETLARELEIRVLPPTVADGRSCTVLIEGLDVTWALRSRDVDERVSIPSKYPGVREALTRKQREIAQQGRIVMVGRDIGTVVLPDADLKIYLVASVEARARRRWLEMQAKGRDDSYEDILAAMRKRDALDSGRNIAPLKPAPDAIVYDTTHVSIKDVLEHFMTLIAGLNGNEHGRES
jgi:cytidylate kinase